MAAASGSPPCTPPLAANAACSSAAPGTVTRPSGAPVQTEQRRQPRRGVVRRGGRGEPARPSRDRGGLGRERGRVRGAASGTAPGIPTAEARRSAARRSSPPLAAASACAGILERRTAARRGRRARPASTPGSTVRPAAPGRARRAAARPSSSSRSCRAVSISSARPRTLRCPRPGRAPARASTSASAGTPAGGLRRKWSSEAQLELRRSGRRRRDGRGAHVERGQPQDAQVGLGRFLVPGPAVAGASVHAVRGGRAGARTTPRAPARAVRRSCVPSVGQPVGGRPARVEQHEQAVRHADPGARRPDELRLGRRRLAARERVDRGSCAQRVALHELVDALGGQEVAERVDGVVERAQLGVDRLLLGRSERRQADLRVAERDRARVPAPVLRAGPPATAEREPVDDVVRADGLGRLLAQLSAQLVELRAGGCHGRVCRVELGLEVGDRLLERVEQRVGDGELRREVADARLRGRDGRVRRVERREEARTFSVAAWILCCSHCGMPARGSRRSGASTAGCARAPRRRRPGRAGSGGPSAPGRARRRASGARLGGGELRLRGGERL